MSTFSTPIAHYVCIVWQCILCQVWLKLSHHSSFTLVSLGASSPRELAPVQLLLVHQCKQFVGSHLHRHCKNSCVNFRERIHDPHVQGMEPFIIIYSKTYPSKLLNNVEESCPKLHNVLGCFIEVNIVELGSQGMLSYIVFRRTYIIESFKYHLWIAIILDHLMQLISSVMHDKLNYMVLAQFSFVIF